MWRISFTIVIITLISCQEKNNQLIQKDKKYEYIEIVSTKSIFGDKEIKEKEAKIINAKTDSIAYLRAYQNFCISEKISIDFEETYGSTGSKPTKFKLIDEEGKNIALLIHFNKIHSFKASIKSRVCELRNYAKESKEKYQQNKIADFKKSGKIDSTKVKKLEAHFNIKKDEFDPNGDVWHKPKSAPKYTNRNGIYCYFQSNDGMPSNLRFRVQYHSDKWLFIRKVQFSIDGKAYEFIPRKMERDSGNGGRIWEWFDEPMGKSNTNLLNALTNAKSAKMKLIGSQYHDVLTITSTEIKNINRSLELFKAMGGDY